jgi:hypothetical protein
MSQVIVNGHTYSDDATATRDMQNGGHRDWLLPMISDTMVDINTKLAQAVVVPAVSAATVYTRWDTGTADANPGAGYVRGNNATSGLITTLYLANIDIFAADLSALVDTFDGSTSTIKGYLTLRKTTDVSKWITFLLTARVAAGGYRKLTVTLVAQSAASPFAQGDGLALQFARTGDAGVVPAIVTRRARMAAALM